MTKRIGYKQQIEQELFKNNWEVVEIYENSVWWCDEYWKVLTKFDPTLSFYLCFVVDPQYDHSRKKGQGIIEIRASREFPEYWNNEIGCIAKIDMQKGKFDSKLKQFISDIEYLKEINYGK